MTTTPETQEKPIRAGVFSSVAEADATIQRLIEAGFTAKQITVVCPDNLTEHFHAYHHQAPAGTKTASSSTMGGVVGAALGGTVAATGSAMVVDPNMFVTLGVAGTAAGALVGGFIGAMVTRGTEKELANFYAEGVPDGQILVAVEVHGSEQEESLHKAAHIIAKSGADPHELREG